MRKFLLAPVLAVGVLVAAVAPAGAWSAPKPPPSITDIVAKSGGTFDSNRYDYDILLKAVLTAKLENALADTTKKYTVFAPDDAAFMRTARDLGWTGSGEASAWNFLVDTLTTLGGGNPVPVLTDILLYHVANGALNPFQVLFAGSIDTLLGSSFDVRFLRLVDAAPKRPDPYLNVFALNIKASNGVIHGITRVLLPVDV